MRLYKRLLPALTACAALLSGPAIAHPGHQHEPGVLPAIAHAVTGWEQLLILLAAGLVAGYLVLRQR